MAARAAEQRGGPFGTHHAGLAVITDAEQQMANLMGNHQPEQRVGPDAEARSGAVPVGVVGEGGVRTVAPSVKVNESNAGVTAPAPKFVPTSPTFAPDENTAVAAIDPAVTHAVSDVLFTRYCAVIVFVAAFPINFRSSDVTPPNESPRTAAVENVAPASDAS